MSHLHELAQRLMTLEDKIADCMRCGMCQAVCPMYGASGQEADVARGKLFLINNLAHMILTDPQSLADKLGRCLLCHSCETACPSGVDIMRIFRDARELVYNYLGLSPAKKFIFRILLAQPALFNLSMLAGAPAQSLLFKKTGSSQGTICAPMFNHFLGERHLPPLAIRPLHSITGPLDEPRKKNTPKVAFFPGCVADKMYVSMGEACIKVLRHHGVAIYMPDKYACCGLPAICSGDAVGMLKELKTNLDVLGKADFDYIITPCASCTSTITNLWPEYAARIGRKEKEQAEELASRAMDINVFLVEVLGVKAVEPRYGAKKITYHDPCHLLKSLGVSREPREVVKASSNVEFHEMNEAERCCGCGGSFNLFHYDYSRQIGQRKRDNVIESGAEVVATGCPACMMQLEDVFSRNGDAVEVKHTIQVYADSLD